MKPKMNAKQLRDLPENPQDVINELKTDIKRFPMYLILDNVYDTYNIGGLFRLADALAMEKIYICGDSETPPNHRIKKASIGTYKVVPWEYHETTIGAIEKLREEVPNIQVVAVELGDKAVSYDAFAYQSPLALVVGNETHGVAAEVIQTSDALVDLPMHGYNVSLNVIVSAAIVAYHAHNTMQT